ncbi:MAG: right-handed parallel beta-helix repeat-containing protein [Planctomycetes bacterium]|nr:right-handed parallel beta-helix repeat-containing protein [Planctomycetota bacterium]MBL7037515.1 polysaccharide lyase 6 family protein [Pirellulaceae bacterium]
MIRASGFSLALLGAYAQQAHAQDQPPPAARLEAESIDAQDRPAQEHSIRVELQRPVDARLLRMEKQGVEGCGLFDGKVYFVAGPKEVQALSRRLKPGDQLVLSGTNWQNARFTFSGRGTEAQPILVRPEVPGQVVFKGDSSVAFDGAHLVITGLEFKDLAVTRKGSVIFRLGNGRDRPAAHCIVNRVTIANCNSPDLADRPRVRMWYMVVRGHDNTVANSLFSDLKNFGQMLAAQELPPGELQRLHVLNNRFVNRPYLDEQNGYEIIQIGWSGEKARSAGSLIEGNVFENCDGENEIISLKASDIVVRRNTFNACQGVLCLRSANRVLVEGNIFDGKGRSNTGGVRIQGSDHVIIENEFRNLRKPKNYYCWPISLMAASAENYGDHGDVQGYGRAKNILIARNRFTANDARIAVGIYPRPEYPLLPRSIQVTDNVFRTTEAATSAFDYVAPDTTGALRENLHESGNKFLLLKR